MTLKRYRAAWLGAMLVIIALGSGCIPVRYISAYDETTDQLVTALHKSVSALLNDLDKAPVPAYASAKDRYTEIKADLRGLQLRNESRPKNELTTRQLAELRAALERVETLHESGTLVQPMIPIQRDTLDQIFRAILKLELAKKAGQEE